MFLVQSYRPDEMLKEYVDSYHFISATFSAPYIENNILPHVFQSLSFNLAEERDMFDMGNNEFVADNTMVGPTHTICKLRVYKGMKRLVVNLKFSGWYKLFKIPVEPFVNRSIRLEDLLGQEITEFSRELRSSEDCRRQKDLTDRFLLRHLTRQKKNSCGNIDEALRLIFESKGRATIAQVADSAFMTRRTLERRFLEQTGLYPKMFSRIIRFNETIRHLEKKAVRHWSALAENLGFYDQSHFINEFQFFAGCSPNHFSRKMSEFEAALYP